MNALIGAVLNQRYRVSHVLGSGGMGRVYLAEDHHKGRRVAVKRVPYSDLITPEQRLFEAGVLQGLRHPNLPAVYDTFRDYQAHYLVMEYIPGATLSERMKSGISLSQALEWTLELLNVVGYLHHQQPPIIHRDIKPENLKFHQDGRLMLVDFGIAKELWANGNTRVSAKAYTAGYAPPEQVQADGRTDTRTDLFSIGALQYALLTGVTPPDVTTRYSRKQYHLNPRDRNQSVPQVVGDVVRRATALSKEKRFQSALDYSRALQNAREQMAYGVAPPPSVADDTAPGVVPLITPKSTGWGKRGRGKHHPPRRNQLVLGLLLLVVAVLTVAALLFFSLQSDSSREVIERNRANATATALAATETAAGQGDDNGTILEAPTLTVPPASTRVATPEMEVDNGLTGVAEEEKPRIVEIRAVPIAVIFESQTGWGTLPWYECDGNRPRLPTNDEDASTVPYPNAQDPVTEPLVQQEGDDILVFFEAAAPTEFQTCGMDELDPRVQYEPDLGAWRIENARFTGLSQYLGQEGRWTIELEWQDRVAAPTAEVDPTLAPLPTLPPPSN